MLQLGREVIVRSDMSQCIPAEALSRTVKQGCWELIDYLTEDGHEGTAMYAVPEDQAGPIELPLHAEGVYKIFLGIQYTKHRTEYGSLNAKLTDDAIFSKFTIETEGRPEKIDDARVIYSSIFEIYWKTADVTGQSMHIQPNRNEISNLSYVKLVPLTEEEALLEQKLQPTEQTQKVAIVDQMGLSGNTRGKPMLHPTDMDWFVNKMQPYLHSDIGMIQFSAIRGNLCSFRTKVGDVGTPDNSWDESWIDPLRAFTDLAHQNGIKLFASIRLIGAANPVIRYPINWARFRMNHPEWAKIDKDGYPCAHPSLAYSEVRQHWLAILREALDYGIDGISLVLNRCSPFVMYEKPVLDSFVEKYGIDPRTLPEEDPRWQEHTAEYLTQFVREVRALVNEKPGRELAVIFKGFPDEVQEGFICNGTDVETWIKEGLVDYLMPSQKSFYPDQVAYWRKLAGDRIQIWPSLLPRRMPGEAYFEQAKAYYEAGANGFLIWDGEGRISRATEWAAIRRLGHREQIEELQREAASYFKRIPLKTLGGISMMHRFRDG